MNEILPILGNFLLAFGINFFVTLLIIQAFYYPKSKRRDYCLTFILMSISIFLLIFVLNDVKMKTGFALGLFAIFSIIRYRTESMPVREMTYLFIIIAISVINAMLGDLDWYIIAASNLLLIASVAISEVFRNRQLATATKLVLYDRIDLITPEKRNELLEDLKKRTGLTIVDIEVGHIDFLKDSAMIKVHYQTDGKLNTVDQLLKFPKPEKDDHDDD